MKETSFFDIFYYIKKNLLLFLVSIIILVGIQSLYFFYGKETEYRGESAFLLNLVRDEEEEIEETDFERLFYLNLQKMETLKDVIQSEPVLESAARSLNDEYGYNFSRQDLAQMVTVEDTTKTQLLLLVVTGTSKETLIDVSTAITESFNQFLEDQLPGEEMTVLSIASIDTVTPNDDRAIRIVSMLLVSLGFAVFIVFCKVLKENRIVDEDFLKEELGYFCLGQIEDVTVQEV